MAQDKQKIIQEGTQLKSKDQIKTLQYIPESRKSCESRGSIIEKNKFFLFIFYFQELLLIG